MPDASERPDVVLFVVDQLAAKWLEEPHAAAVATPNIDRLRERGVTFRNAYSSNPVCAPARATIATGLPSRGHGVLQNGYALSPEITTFMQALQQGGWRTGAFGKLHFRPQFAGAYPEYEPYGFDVTHVTEDSRLGEWLDWVEAEHPAHYEAALATITQVDNPALADYGPAGRDLRPAVEAAKRAFESRSGATPVSSPSAYPLPFPEAVSQTNWITDRAVEFLRGTGADRPLLAQVSYVQPHAPSCPPADYLDAVDEGAITEPVPPEWVDDPLAPACFEEGGPARHANRTLPEGWREHRRHYLADVAHLDAQLGRVVDALEAAGRLESTYVAFLADHGELLYDHGFTGKAQKHYDASVRVPLTIAGPGLEAGAERAAFVQLEDVFPTVLDMAGIGVPTQPVRGSNLEAAPASRPGRSLLPLCRGEAPADPREDAYVESYNNIYSTDPIHWARTIRTDEFRYTAYPRGSGEQLFRVADDPDERRNLAGDDAFADARRELRDRLLDRIVLQDCPHPPRDLYALGVP